MPKYNLNEIEKKLTEAKQNGTTYQEKWQELADYYEVSWQAVYRWYYRAKAKTKKTIVNHLQDKVQNPVILLNSDFWRWLHGSLILGKTSRETEEKIRQDFLKYLPEIQDKIPSYNSQVFPPALPPALSQPDHKSPADIPMRGKRSFHKLLAMQAVEQRKKLVPPPKDKIRRSL